MIAECSFTERKCPESDMNYLSQWDTTFWLFYARPGKGTMFF